jgi:hypothetical protein
MDRDDLLAMLDTLRNPVLAALQQADELSGRGSLKRIARDAQELQRWVPEPDMFSARALEAQRVLSLPDIDFQQHLNRSHLDVARQRADQWASDFQQDATGLAETHAQLEDLLDSGRVIRDMRQQFGSVLPGYGAYLDHTKAALSDHSGSVLSDRVLAAVERDFSLLAQSATALGPLQRLTETIVQSFGAAMTPTALRDLLNPAARSAWDGIWEQRYIEFAAHVSESWLDTGDLDDGSDTSASSPVSVGDTVPKESLEKPTPTVWELAARYGIVGYEIQARLTRLAKRTDPLAAHEDISWERMLLAVGYAHPTYRARLMQLAYPFLQHFDWSLAKRGKRVDGSPESLSLEDVEAFEELSQALIALLREIEEAYGA